jgi:hypothetical protein
MTLKLPEFLQKIEFKRLPPPLLLASWLGGLFVAAFLLLFLTEGARENQILRSVNRVLAVEGVSLSQRLDTVGPAAAFRWYAVHPSDDYVSTVNYVSVFNLLYGADSLPFAALVDASGAVKEFYPLSLNAARISGRLSPDAFSFYSERLRLSFERVLGKAGN